MKVDWTEPAVTDLRHVRAYIGRRNRQAASSIARRIRAVVTLLDVHPAAGRAGRVPGTRELVVTGTPYLVAYRVRRGTIEILRVLHGAQEWPDKVP